MPVGMKRQARAETPAPESNKSVGRKKLTPAALFGAVAGIGVTMLICGAFITRAQRTSVEVSGALQDQQLAGAFSNHLVQRLAASRGGAVARQQLAEKLRQTTGQFGGKWAANSDGDDEDVTSKLDEVKPHVNAQADPEVMQKLDLMEEKVKQLVAAKQRAAQLAAEGMHLMPDGSEMLDSEMVSKDDQVPTTKLWDGKTQQRMDVIEAKLDKLLQLQAAVPKQALAAEDEVVSQHDLDAIVAQVGRIEKLVAIRDEMLAEAHAKKTSLAAAVSAPELAAPPPIAAPKQVLAPAQKEQADKIFHAQSLEQVTGLSSAKKAAKATDKGRILAATRKKSFLLNNVKTQSLVRASPLADKKTSDLAHMYDKVSAEPKKTSGLAHMYDKVSTDQAPAKAFETMYDGVLDATKLAPWLAGSSGEGLLHMYDSLEGSLSAVQGSAA